jgi:hypothetical protein
MLCPLTGPMGYSAAPRWPPPGSTIRPAEKGSPTSSPVRSNTPVRPPGAASGAVNRTRLVLTPREGGPAAQAARRAAAQDGYGQADRGEPGRHVVACRPG